jgi:hypothetical protein
MFTKVYIHEGVRQPLTNETTPDRSLTFDVETIVFCDLFVAGLLIPYDVDISSKDTEPMQCEAALTHT